MRYILIIVLFTNTIYSQKAIVKDTIVFKFDSKHIYMEKTHFFNEKNSKSTTYSFIKFLSREAEDAVSLVSYDFSDNSKQINFNSKLISKDIYWLNNKITLSYCFFKNYNHKDIFKFIMRDNIVLYIHEEDKKKGNNFLLREVFINKD